MASGKSDKTADALPSVADLDTKIAALQTLKASLIAAHAVGALGGVTVAGTVSQGVPVSLGTPVDLPRGALLGKSVPAAIRLYLSAARQKKPSREIAAALKEGGVESLAANFETTVSSALHRMKENHEVFRFDEGWALAEFYPDSYKNRFAKDAKPTKAARKRSKKKGATANGRKAKVRTGKREKAGPTLDNRVLSYVKAHSATGVTVKDTAEAVGETDAKRVAMSFARLSRYGRVSKGDGGLYRVA